MGGAMAVYGVIFALLQNDVRRLLSYHIVSQVGYMVAGVGIGTELGSTAALPRLQPYPLQSLAFHVHGSGHLPNGEEKAYRAGWIGRENAGNDDHLHRRGPFDLRSPGFQRIREQRAGHNGGRGERSSLAELMLILASVGTFLSFAKLCYFTFFAKNEAMEAEEAPVPCNSPWR